MKQEKSKDLLKVGQVEKNIQLETVYRRILPKLNTNFSELISAHILLVLRLEGIVGKKISDNDYKMIEDIKSKLLKNKSMKSELMQNIKDILED
tara:strand:+ start:259 stop:540 length:282 start_codon:yes stop_codon:yes gene_type:complete